MNNMNGAPTIEQYNNSQETAAADLLPSNRVEDGLTNPPTEVLPVESKPEGGNQVTTSEPLQPEIVAKPIDFSVGFGSMLQQTPDDKRVEAVLAKLNGEKLPLAV